MGVSSILTLLTYLLPHPEWLEKLPPTFTMAHLLQGLYAHEHINPEINRLTRQTKQVTEIQHTASMLQPFSSQRSSFLRFFCRIFLSASFLQQHISLPIYTVSHKKRATKLLSICSSNIDHFSKFVHWRTLWTVCNNVIIKHPATPYLCCYITM